MLALVSAFVQYVPSSNMNRSPGKERQAVAQGASRFAAGPAARGIDVERFCPYSLLHRLV